MEFTLPEKAKQVSGLLKVLSNENRLLILCLLADGPLSVGQITECLPGISQSGVSQHLAILKSHDILDSTKSAQTIRYFISDDRVLKIMEVLKEQYCQI